MLRLKSYHVSKMGHRPSSEQYKRSLSICKHLRSEIYFWRNVIKSFKVYIPLFLSRRQFNYICISVGQYANHGSLRAKYLRRRVAKQTISRCRYLQIRIPHTHQSSPRRFLAPASIQKLFSATWISIIKIRSSWEHLSFVVRIHILVRRHL